MLQVRVLQGAPRPEKAEGETIYQTVHFIAARLPTSLPSLVGLSDICQPNRITDCVQDGDALRMQIERVRMPVTPGKADRMNRHAFDALFEAIRNVIKR